MGERPKGSTFHRRCRSRLEASREQVPFHPRPHPHPRVIRVEKVRVMCGRCTECLRYPALARKGMTSPARVAITRQTFLTVPSRAAFRACSINASSSVHENIAPRSSAYLRTMDGLEERRFEEGTKGGERSWWGE